VADFGRKSGNVCGTFRCAAVVGDDLIDLAVPGNLPGSGDFRVSLPTEAGRLECEAAVDLRLDAVGLRQAEPDGRAKIGHGTAGFAHLPVGDPAQIEGLGRTAGRDIVRVDRGRELPDGVLVFACGKRRRAALQPGFLGLSRAGSESKRRYKA
jgi:hypothetical protein